MARTRVNFRLPEDLVERADLVAAVERTNRTEVVTEALRNHLDALESQDSFREALVEPYLDGEVDFAALREALGRRDAEAVRASKSILDGSEELAGTLADGDADGG